MSKGERSRRGGQGGAQVGPVGSWEPQGGFGFHPKGWEPWRAVDTEGGTQLRGPQAPSAGCCCREDGHRGDAEWDQDRGDSAAGTGW